MGVAKNGFSLLRQIWRGKRPEKIRLGGRNETLKPMRLNLLLYLNTQNWKISRNFEELETNIYSVS